jgi:malonyl-CoA/methylmalonyl-CoA synthetase
MTPSTDHNLYSHLRAGFAKDDAPCLILPDDSVITYGQARKRIGQYAAAFKTLGLGREDRVTVQAEKSIESLFLYLGVIQAGGTYNPLNTAYTQLELEYFISDAQPHVVVCDPGIEDSTGEIATRYGVKHVLCLDSEGTGSMSDLADKAETTDEIVAVETDDVASIIYTSGTTGRSKGAMLTHKNLTSNARTLHQYWQFVPGDVLLHALPIYHVHGLFVACHCALLNGSPMYFMAKFDLDKVLERLATSTVMMGVPTFYTRLLKDHRFTKELTANMRLFISGSAPLLTETHIEFEQRTGHRILERYGMTEAGMITSNPYEGERVAGTVGFALPGIEARIAGENGEILKAGEIGVLEIKGPNVFKGYRNMPDKTAEEFRPDGFFITGDVATMDDEGRIAIVGRGKDLIISGGLNIYPKEIESEIDDLEGVTESAVIGVPHPDFGESVVAVVVAKPGATPTQNDIINPLDGRLARFKLPKRVFFVDELPRNTMGKVQKNVLREHHKDLFAIE